MNFWAALFEFLKITGLKTAFKGLCKKLLKSHALKKS